MYWAVQNSYWFPIAQRDDTIEQNDIFYVCESNMMANTLKHL